MAASADRQADSPFEQGIQFTIEASRRTGKKLTPQEASDYWTREVVDTARSRPAPLAWKILQKPAALFNQFEAGDHYHIPFLSAFVTFFKVPFLSFWMILPLGMSGMLVSIVRQRASRAPAPIAALYGVTLIVFFTTARYRLPRLVIMIPFAAMALWRLAASLRRKAIRQTVAPMVIITAFLIVEFIPVRDTDDLTAYYDTHAIVLDSKGLATEAMSYWKISSDMDKPFSAFANLALAGKYFQRGDFQQGNIDLNKISDDSFAAAYKYELSGDAMAHGGRMSDAISAYNRSLQINSGQRRVLVKRSRLYGRTNPFKAFQEKERLKTIASFYDLM